MGSSQRSLMSPRSLLRIELITAGRYQQPAAAAEEQTGRADGTRTGELHGSNLVTVAVEDVGERHRQRHPELSRWTDAGGADDGCDERYFAILNAAPRPPRRLRVEQPVEFAAFDVTLEHQRARVAVLTEDRPAADEHVVEPASGIDERKPRVHGDVHVAIVLEPRGPQSSDAALRVSTRGVFGEERAALGMGDEQRRAGVLHRTGAVEHHVAEDDPRRRCARQKKSGEQLA